MKRDKTISICFFGSSDEGENVNLSRENNALLKKIGVYISNLNNIKKLIVITGGYGGIMREISKILREYCCEFEIEIIGITSDVYSIDDVKKYNNENTINEFNDTLIHTQNLTERIQSMIDLSDNFIVLPGKQGTLTELLLTYEAFRYPEARLKGKKVTFYIHDYWKSLLKNEVFFRSMENIVFFNYENFKFKFINSKNYQNTYEKFDFKYNDDFKAFKIKLENIFKINFFKKNYDYSNLKNPIINIDLAYVFYENQEKPDQAKFASYYITEYDKILKEFLISNNSLLFSEEENTFKIAYIDNNFYETKSAENELNYLKEYTEIPFYRNDKEKGTFERWVKILRENKMGKTVIWSFNRSVDEQNQFKIDLSLFITLNIEIPNEIVKKVKRIIDQFYLSYKMKKVNQIFIDKQKILKQKALQSSIVSVLSRNGSHNIGSHVLNKLSNKKEIDDFLKIKLNSNGNYSLKKFTSKRYNPNKKENPKELLRIFNSYLKNRMDFIADVATSTRAAIQTSKKFKNEVFNDFDRNLLLLDNISGKGDEFQYKFQFLNSKNEVLKEVDDPSVYMPNDILGQQAFYIILENIIRNTAKHSGGKENKKIIIFSIKIEGINEINGYYRISIFDDIKGNGLDNLVKTRNKNINLPIIDANNEIRSKGWGTIEMKLAAAYLSRVDISDIDEENYKTLEIKNKNSNGYFPILQAKKFKLIDSEGFGYFFYLAKPKEILIIDFTIENELINSGNAFSKNQGIDILHYTDDGIRLGTDVKNRAEFVKRSIFPHEFMLLYFGDNEKLYKDNIHQIKNLQLQGNTPNRTVLYLNNSFHYLNTSNVILNKEHKQSGIKPAKLFENINSEDLLNKLWGAFYIRNIPRNYQISCTGDYGDIFPQEQFKKEAFFGRHGELSANQYDYYEPFGSSSLLGIWFENYKHGKNIYPSRVKLLEAVISKVVIIDERIQDVLNNIGYISENFKNTNQDFTFQELFQKSKILVPSKKSINLKTLDLVKERKNLFNYFDTFVKNADFIVFHFGILESLCRRDEDVKTVIKEIKNVLNKNNKNYKFILTSGRGVTDDIPKEEYFINFSALSQYAIDMHNRSKLHLIALLQSVRKKRDHLS